METGTRVARVDLAKKIRVNEITIVNWEKKKTKPDRNNLEIKDGFGKFNEPRLDSQSLGGGNRISPLFLTLRYSKGNFKNIPSG